MALLHVLEAGRTGFLDLFFQGVTWLGQDLFTLALVLVLFWCANKNLGYYLLCGEFFALSLNMALKNLFQVPRPWVRDPALAPLPSALPAATGYSFPSGHTANATLVFGSLARRTKGRLPRALFCLAFLLVGFSRLYLGVHTPADVLTSLALSLAAALVLHPVCRRAERSPRFARALSGAAVLWTLAAAVLCRFVPLRDAAMAEVFASVSKDAWGFFGAACAFFLVRELDEARLRWKTDAAWWAQIGKCVLGLLLTVLLRESVKAPLLALTGDRALCELVRNFLVVLFAGGVWPATFRFWGTLGRH